MTTLAGGTSGYRDGVGDGAQFNSPAGIVVDRKTGVVTVADCRNHRLRRIDRDGRVTTVAGNGGVGPLVDGPVMESPNTRPQLPLIAQG